VTTQRYIPEDSKLHYKECSTKYNDYKKHVQSWLAVSE